MAKINVLSERSEPVVHKFVISKAWIGRRDGSVSLCGVWEEMQYVDEDWRGVTCANCKKLRRKK